MMALLEVRNLSISIRRGQHYYTAVNGINFSINAGEIAALAGESGSGKSLTALSIVRLLPPKAKITGGEILYSTNETVNLCHSDEESLCRIRGREIAMIFQEPRQSLNPLMRVGTQIAETLELHGMHTKSANGAALDILRQLKFPEPEQILRAWPHQLSGGMCQRVMIAIAAICRPRLLIADEPITALDPANREHILDLLKQINREFGTAILFISHDLSAVQHFCSRFSVMYSGHIIEEGPSEAMLTPLHPYTIGLVGAIPRKENRTQSLAVISGKAPALEEPVSGCPFAPRCPKVQAVCTANFPPWTNKSDGRRVCCFMEYGSSKGVLYG
ncbi:MAG: ABC transporter ATP-binding protein [Treponema sp.]|nr:ABC transporter ATP-binding protein [Treponema sp.]